MRRILLTLALCSIGAFAFAQPYQWSEEYAPEAPQGGAIEETFFGDFLTLNPVLSSGASEAAVLSMVGGPAIIYRDWVGNRSLRNDDGSFNLLWASDIEEVREEQEFIITLREGWQWSDGVEMTADDLIATQTIISDPDVQSNAFDCGYVGTEGDQPVTLEKLGTYQVRLTLPEPQVNALGRKLCANYNTPGMIPAHIFMPVYEEQGAEGILSLWGIDTPPDQIVSGGPYTVAEFRPGERVVLEKNPLYGEAAQAANGDPLPGPDRWTVTFTEDRNAQLALVTTGQASFYWPTTLDEVRAVQQAVQNGSINGELFANIGPDSLVDFMTYNFNTMNECKSTLFNSPDFRQAIAIMIDRDALVDAALGGLGFPAKDFNSDSAEPFNVPNLEPFEFNPERGVEILNGLGYTETGQDGVLRNPDTGCRVSFDLQFNSGNNRRAQEAQVIAQTLSSYGVEVNPREVSTEIWSNSITGTDGLPRQVDYDAQIWGLAGGDVDNPSSVNVVGLGVNLNSWNKSTEDVEPWEITMARLSQRMDATLDLDERIAIYNQRAELMREYLPITPLISPAFNFYENMTNIWPEDTLDSNSIESPYNPGNFRQNVATPQN